MCTAPEMTSLVCSKTHQARATVTGGQHRCRRQQHTTLGQVSLTERLGPQVFVQGQGTHVLDIGVCCIVPG